MRAAARAGVSPVPGTAAAQAAAEAAARAAGRPPHVLLAPVGSSRAASTRGTDGMSPAEVADRIVAVLLQGSGPILLCVPGTRGATWETSMLATARAVLGSARGAISAASIPYRNGIVDIGRRLLGLASASDHDVLALVIRRLRAQAPQRPILVAAESQGAWLVADTLRAQPSLASAVARLVLFAKPGFVPTPAAVGAARSGAGMLAAGRRQSRGILEFRHVDDVVPSLFHRLGWRVAVGWLDAVTAWRRTGTFDYPPHHYDRHGREAADWLLHGQRPARPPVHHSSRDC